MTVERLLPTLEARELVRLAAEVADKVLDPIVDEHEKSGTARATYLDAARRDAGLPYSRNASVAKLIATDVAMKVTTDAVQVFGGYGYTRDYRVERYMREAKITQIFEGTNQIQRLVIGRSLAGS
jgi:alkylation response protein AidB-like acyl-CoA dehydrogenase